MELLECRPHGTFALLEVRGGGVHADCSGCWLPVRLQRVCCSSARKPLSFPDCRRSASRRGGRGQEEEEEEEKEDNDNSGRKSGGKSGRKNGIEKTGWE